MKITDHEKCVGCGACVLICPKNAIAMTPDEEGFSHPYVDETVCVECGLCQKSCPAESPCLQGGQKAYALKHKTESARSKCTSGGAFIALSDKVLAEGGVVYGVVYDETFCAIHARTETASNRDAMCGSKYVQSDTRDTFQQVAEDLKVGRQVLYTGTSCQIDGLGHYLRCKNADTDKLITVGLICHGTPSPKLWQDHIRNIQARRKKGIAEYFNRSKIRGWHEHNECIAYEDGKMEYYSKLSQNHKDLFYDHYIIRPSCSVCAYAKDPSTADITIADFWGVQYVMPQLDDNRGVSLVLTNSEKGDAIVNVLKDVDLWEADRETALSYNHTKPCKPNPRREEFWKDYRTHGYRFVCAKYANDSFKGRILYGGKKRLRALLVKLKILSA